MLKIRQRASVQSGTRYLAGKPRAEALLGALMANLRKYSTNAPAIGMGTSREPTLELRIAELEEQLQVFDDFLAMVAHELRNPMTPISAQVELLLAKASGNHG